MADDVNIAMLTKIVDMHEKKINETAKELQDVKQEIKECLLFMKIYVERIKTMEDKIDSISENIQSLMSPNQFHWERNKSIDDNLKDYAKRIEELESFKSKTNEFISGISGKYQQFKLFVKYPLVTIGIFIFISVALIDIIFGTGFLHILASKFITRGSIDG